MTGPAVPVPVPAQQFWWLHDARWYQAVLARFGQEAANELNDEVCGFVARRFATWYVRAHELAPTADVEQLSERLDAVSRAMFGTGATEQSCTVTGPHSFETVVSKNFALKMLQAAGTLDGYACPCLTLRRAWLGALGVQARDRCTECLRTGGAACRFTADVISDDTALSDTAER